MFPWESVMKYLLFYHHAVNLLDSYNHFRLGFVCSLVIIPMERAEKSTGHHFVTYLLRALALILVLSDFGFTPLPSSDSCWSLFLTEVVTPGLSICKSSTETKMIRRKDSRLCLP